MFFLRCSNQDHKPQGHSKSLQRKLFISDPQQTLERTAQASTDSNQPYQWPKRLYNVEEKDKTPPQPYKRTAAAAKPLNFISSS
jgi:hypothetical protein